MCGCWRLWRSCFRLQAHASEVRLSQCHASVKHGRVSTTDNTVRDEDALDDFAAAGSGAEEEEQEEEQQHLAGDQDHHVDFWDNILLVPGRRPPPSVAALCYYSDVEECAGATHLTRTPLSAAETMLSSSGAGTPPPGHQVRRSAARETQPAVVEETGAGRIPVRVRLVSRRGRNGAGVCTGATSAFPAWHVRALPARHVASRHARCSGRDATRFTLFGGVFRATGKCIK
eukprot:SAG25_NODE_414_length_8276_cov_29.934939_4_plen_230_part_00